MTKQLQNETQILIHKTWSLLIIHFKRHFAQEQILSIPGLLVDTHKHTPNEHVCTQAGVLILALPVNR